MNIQPGTVAWSVRRGRADDGSKTWRYRARLYRLEPHEKLKFLVWRRLDDLGPLRETEAEASTDGQKSGIEFAPSVFSGKLEWWTRLVVPAHEESLWRMGVMEFFLVWKADGKMYPVAVVKVIREPGHRGRYVLYKKLGSLSGIQLGRLESDFPKYKARSIPQEEGREVELEGE